MLACFQACCIHQTPILWDIVSVRGNFLQNNPFTKTKISLLLNLTCVKDDPGDLESWVFRELDQS